MELLDLHVDYMSRFGGGVIYADRPPLVTDVGMVMPQVMEANKRMYLLESGVYLVRFKEMLPSALAEDCTSYDLLQFNLMSIGMHLVINKKPFVGYLTVFYRSQIEMGAKLAALEYEVYDFDIETGTIKR